MLATDAAARPGATAYDATNACLLAAALAVALLQFFLAPFLLPSNAWCALGLVSLCAIATPLHWGLMHESIHANLFSPPAVNRRAGRALGNLLCLSWDVMRFGHLLHHSNNRHQFDRPEIVPPGSSRLRRAGPYFFKLLGGHALISFASSVGIALLSRFVARLVPSAEPMRTAALRAFGNPERQSRIRGDFCAILVLLTVGGICWGARWPILAAAIGARFLVLSLLDNAPHYATPIDSGARARNTRLPRWAHWLVMGHNFHGMHHRATGLKWQDLRAAFETSGSGFDGRWTAMVLRQFRGPVALD